MKPVSLPRSGFYVATFLLLSLAFLAPNRAVAQQATAQLLGTVKDPTGAVVLGAKVTLTNSNTNVSHNTATNKDGGYLFTLVPIGTYEVTVEQTGFETYVHKNITLEINQNGRLDVSLQLGSTNQIVEVQGDVTQVDTVTATLGKVETTQRILALPLVERNTLQLGLLQAGVFAPDQDDGSSNPFSVSGQRSESITFLLDGADNNDFLGNNLVVNPNPDAVAEFKILTNNYTPEYGRTSGGVINQVIKSGTNAVHGSAFEFFRNTSLDASDYFLQQVPILRRNLFGGTIGFPIKKDKLFFFASYQGARRSEGQNPGQIPVLSQAERTGNFSELLPDTQLFDPTTGYPYPNNQVPVDPVMASYIKNYLPLPNVPGTNNFQSDPVAQIRDDQFIFRFDYNISNRDTLSAVYIFDDSPDNYPFKIINGASSGGNVPIGSGFTDAQRYQAANVAWTRTISPTMVNEFRFATNRRATLDNVPTTTTSPSTLGFLTVTPDDPKGTAPPLITINGGPNLGPNPEGPTKIHDTTFQYQDTLSWTKGHHDLKFGVDLRWVENNFNFDFFNNGSFTFGDADFGPLSGGTFTGNALSDFVGGFFGNYFQFSNAVYGIRTHDLYFFGQDSWKATKKLTFTYGLRYEYSSPQVDPHNNIIGWYPGQQSTVYPAAPSNFLYPGDPGTPNRGLVYPDRNNFAPRFGFAWDMLGNAKLVMRGGYGIFYDIEDGALNLQFGGQPPFGYVANNSPVCFVQGGAADGCLSSQTNGSYTADPFQGVYPNPYPFVAGGNLGKFFVPALPFAYVVTPHFRTPYAQNFNFGFQYQVARNTMIEAVYVGSLSRKAIGSTETNYPLLATLQQQYLANGYFGLNPECARPLAECDSPLDPFGSPAGAQQIFTNVSSVNSSSNQFQLTIEQRLTHGVQFRLAYTNAKTIDDASGFRARSSTFTDPTDPKLDRGLADFDAPQRLVISPVWQIPFGNGGKTLTRKLLGGWSVATIVSFQSGNPFTLFSNNNSGELDNFADRPDVISPVQIFHNPRQIQTLSGDCGGGTAGHYYFNPADLECNVGNPIGLPPDPNLIPGGVPLFTHGDMGRNSLRGPGINNWDMSIAKSINLTESKSIEFRSEFYNAFNHVQFLSPTLQNGTEGFDSLFGQITSDRGARIIQFALKMYF